MDGWPPCVTIGGLVGRVQIGYADGQAVDGRPDDVMVLSKPFTPGKLSKAILSVL